MKVHPKWHKNEIFELHTFFILNISGLVFYLWMDFLPILKKQTIPITSLVLIKHRVINVFQSMEHKLCIGTLNFIYL